GLIVGTAGYMSPEQAEGKTVDARSDIFSFGSVLYEMVTGRRAFRRDSPALTLTAILHLEPLPLPAGVPHDLEKVITRCLRKDPAHRFQHMGDAKVELEELKEESDSGKLTAAQAPAGPRPRRLLRLVLVAAAVLVLAVGSVFRWQRVHANPLTDKDVLVLADFTNTTGDSVFDDTLKQGLSVQLEQSPFLNLVSERKVNETLKLMGRPAGDRLTPEVTREVCQRTSSKAMLAGSIAELGSQYVIGLKAVNCDTGDMLAEAQEQAAGKEEVLKALDAAAVRLRSKLGESLSSVEKYATPVEEATTPSLEALKAYSLGVKTLFAKGETAALPLFQRALDLDPNFAMAYARMVAVYVGRGETGLGAENARKAYELREKVSEWERFFIEGLYYGCVTGELEKAAQTVDLWQQTYPRDYFTYLARGATYAALGNYEKALEDHREALRLDPNNASNYLALGNDYMALNRLDEAEAVYKQAEERKLEGGFLLGNRYWLAFLKGDAAQMAQLVSGAMGKPGVEDNLLALQADTEGWYGKLKNARELTGRAMDSARRNDAIEAAAAYQAAAALREVESGNRERARAEAHAALKLAPNREVRAMAALALARAGDTAGAEKLAAELDKSFPLDTLVQKYWLPTIRAAVVLERKDPNRAIDLLKVASTIELSPPTSIISYLCPVYVRGEAWLMLRDGNRAAAEFQKFIDHRGMVVNFPWGALARLGLARAYALQGDTPKARAAYQDFLTLWKDADPDVPILKEAKAEYAKLK
ncbi:MAG TPA: tetratricopeptide repeat protein, partial [Dongiaceae bacterium]|nr:tetratricopeptide repeat protein [Dongiaceae bacterium]